MADVATTYTLTTSGGTIVFNTGSIGDGTDKYWINSIRGLDSPTLRVPIDPVPFGDGGIVHQTWKGPRHVVVDGLFLVESPVNCMERRMDLQVALMDALESIIAPNQGWLEWQWAGQLPQQILCSYEVGLETTYSDNFLVLNFSFGLVSEMADPEAAT